MTAISIEYTGLGRALQALGFGQDAAEYHGTLCGMLCVLQDIPEDLGLTAEYSPNASEDVQSAARAQIADLHSESLDALLDVEMEFSPLLPSDDEALGSRVEALALWCQGFLLGLSSRPALDFNALSPDLREAIEDLIQISRAQLGSDEEEGVAEDDEAAYIELLEYVRAAVQLLFLELRPNATPDPDELGGATVH